MRTMRTKTFAVIWLAALIAVSPATAHPQGSAPLPDTPAARQFSSWLTAFNSADRATLSQALHRPADHRQSGYAHAYGFEDLRLGGVRCFGHGGGAPGKNGDLEICPQSGYTIAVLANMDPPAA
jgi:hypothetical protein